MMIFIISVGAWVLSFLHIIIHAFFKRMLFLSTGSLIGQMRGAQDSRLYGSSLSNFSSFLYFVVRSLCLSGFPFFLGFYSKDFIISSRSFGEGIILFLFFLLGCFLTVIYRVRLVYKAYSVIYKYTSLSFSSESKFFFIPVSLLFLKCWTLGGFLFWFFLSGIRYFFFYFDLFIGIYLFILGTFFYFLLSFYYSFSFYLGMISFFTLEDCGRKVLLF